MHGGGHKDPSFFKRSVLQIGRRNDGSLWPPLCTTLPQRTSLDPLWAVGAVQVDAAVGAENVAGLYVVHLASAHGALLFLACRHPSCAGIRFILLILTGAVPAAAAISSMRAPAPGSPPACLDRRRTLSPRLRGAAELKLVPNKCEPLSIFQSAQCLQHLRWYRDYPCYTCG